MKRIVTIIALVFVVLIGGISQDAMARTKRSKRSKTRTSQVSRGSSVANHWYKGKSGDGNGGITFIKVLFKYDGSAKLIMESYDTYSTTPQKSQAWGSYKQNGDNLTIYFDGWNMDFEVVSPNQINFINNGRVGAYLYRE